MVSIRLQAQLHNANGFCLILMSPINVHITVRIKNELSSLRISLTIRGNSMRKVGTCADFQNLWIRVLARQSRSILKRTRQRMIRIFRFSNQCASEFCCRRKENRHKRKFERTVNGDFHPISIMKNPRHTSFEAKTHFIGNHLARNSEHEGQAVLFKFRLYDLHGITIKLCTPWARLSEPLIWAFSQSPQGKMDNIQPTGNCDVCNLLWRIKVDRIKINLLPVALRYTRIF